MASITLARIDENLRAAGLSRAAFAAVCGLKPSTLSAAYNSIVNLGGPREAEMLSLSHLLLSARTACEPFALPADANMVRVLVNRLMDGTLAVEKIRETVSSLFEQ
jgi:hypothetical protein